MLDTLGAFGIERDALRAAVADAVRRAGRSRPAEPLTSRCAGWFDRAMSDYQPAEDRYDSMEYRYCGRSGLKLPALSLGLWQNFGDDRPEETQRAILRRAFDRGVTHFDLANNYGPPYGRAEENFGRYLARGLQGPTATSW